MPASPFLISLVSIATASLLGSLHCVGMCGAFAVLGCGSGQSKFSYHLGRLTTYLAFGAAAGFLGKQLNLTLSSQTLEQPVALLIGVTFLVWGFSHLSGRKVPNVLRFISPKAVHLARSVLTARLPRPMRSFLIGLGTTLLPCGFLYTFVALAAISGGAPQGALTMLAFWLGTVPLLALAGGIGRTLFLRMGRFAPRIVALLFIISGIVTIAGHMPQDGAVAAPCAKCHGH